MLVEILKFEFSLSKYIRHTHSWTKGVLTNKVHLVKIKLFAFYLHIYQGFKYSAIAATIACYSCLIWGRSKLFVFTNLEAIASFSYAINCLRGYLPNALVGGFKTLTREFHKEIFHNTCKSSQFFRWQIWYSPSALC